MYENEDIILGKLRTNREQLENKANKAFFRNTDSVVTPNIVCGNPTNKIDNWTGGIYTGNTISGGGTNVEHANVIGGNPDAVGNPALSNYATTEQKAINTNSNLSVITGGYDNVLEGIGNFISGHHNYTRFPTNHSVINGGAYNKLDWGAYQSIGGGFTNQIKSTAKTSQGISDHSTIGGGSTNLIDDSRQATISGGYNNAINTSDLSFIGGGIANAITATIAGKNTNAIGGGISNSITNGTSSTIGGGSTNKITGDYGAIIGGQNNEIITSNAVILGSNGKATRLGSVVLSSTSHFDSVGDAQREIIIKAVTSDSATAKNITFPTTPSTLMMVTGRIVARNMTTEGEYMGFNVKFLLRCSSGAVTSPVGTPVIESFTSGVAWTIGILSGTTGFVMTVTGEASKTIQWVADFDITQTF